MKHYQNTRKEVEDLVNTRILPSIKENHPQDEELIRRVNMMGFFYSIGRMEALEVLLRLVLLDITGDEHKERLDAYFKEEK